MWVLPKITQRVASLHANKSKLIIQDGVQTHRESCQFVHFGTNLTLIFILTMLTKINVFASMRDILT